MENNTKPNKSSTPSESVVRSEPSVGAPKISAQLKLCYKGNQSIGCDILRLRVIKNAIKAWELQAVDDQSFTGVKTEGELKF